MVMLGICLSLAKWTSSRGEYGEQVSVQALTSQTSQLYARFEQAMHLVSACQKSDALNSLVNPDCPMRLVRNWRRFIESIIDQKADTWV
jgi:hypothetical protein